MPLTLMSPDTSTPVTASPGCNECSHPGAGLESRIELEAPPAATVMPSCWKKGENSRNTPSLKPAKLRGVSMGTMVGEAEKFPEEPAETTCCNISFERFTAARCGAVLPGTRASDGRL